MAVVYRVRHEELGTLAALKVLDRVDPETEHRLLQEGRAQGSIAHPGIVSVLDFVRVDGHAALLLEYVPGCDLAQLLARRCLSVEDGLELFRQIVAAVGAAHAAGLVHRDLKPSNVLVTETPHGLVAKVGDFGLVKSEAADLTVTHALVGTPKYMAPEQMRAARKVDARADLFALGCVLYELVCARPPFPGDDLVELYTAKTGGHYAAPDRLVPDLPRPVSHAITACLEGTVTRRIPSCGTLLAVLSGAPWSAAPESDRTLDVASASWLCPACGAACGAEQCAACGAEPSLHQRYRLVDVLSEGVWRALDLKQGRWVVVRAMAGADRERFDRGARVARELDHPQIARGLEAPFDEHGRRWEVRELVEGVPLAEVLETHRYDEAEVLEVLLQLAPPLRYLAERSPPVVHRALSPAHVIRAEDGRLVLVDFGASRDTRGDGSLLDDPAAAPEAWVGEATPATDVYGLGALAVTLLTRRPAHELRVGDRVAFEDVVSVGEPTRRLLRDMLAPEPGRRPSIGEVARRAGRIAADLRRLPVPDAPPPRRSVFRRVGLAVAALTGFAVPVAGLAALGAGAALLFLFVVIASEESAPVPPLPDRMREPGPDLADRSLPGADCGEAFLRTITVLPGELPAGAKVPLTFATACDGAVRPLGEVEVGLPTLVRLDGHGTLRLPWGELRCEGGARAGACAFRSDEPPDPIRARPTSFATSARVGERGGAPLAGARLVDVEADGLPAPALVAGPDGALALPWGFDGPFGLEVGGVARRAASTAADGIVVEPLGRVTEVEVVDVAGHPLPGARVSCRGEGDGPGAVGLTGADGRLRCDAPQGTVAAKVSAPGFVARTGPLEGPTARFVLEPARTVHVGCAGFPGDRCAHLEEPPACVRHLDGRNDAPAGGCRFAGERLLCECAPEADRLVHGVLGSVWLPPDADVAWFDLRELVGSIEGSWPAARGGGCTARLTTETGALRMPIDELGRFELADVPWSAYGVEASCPDGRTARQDVFVDGRTEVLLAD